MHMGLKGESPQILSCCMHSCAGVGFWNEGHCLPSFYKGGCAECCSFWWGLRLAVHLRC